MDKLPESSDFTYVSDLVIDLWTTERHEGSLSANSVDLEVNFDPEALQPGFNELPVRITALDSSINIIGSYTVVVEVPEADISNDPSDPN